MRPYTVWHGSTKPRQQQFLILEGSVDHSFVSKNARRIHSKLQIQTSSQNKPHLMHPKHSRNHRRVWHCTPMDFASCVIGWFEHPNFLEGGGVIHHRLSLTLAPRHGQEQGTYATSWIATHLRCSIAELLNLFQLSSWYLVYIDLIILSHPGATKTKVALVDFLKGLKPSLLLRWSNSRGQCWLDVRFIAAMGEAWEQSHVVIRLHNLHKLARNMIEKNEPQNNALIIPWKMHCVFSVRNMKNRPKYLPTKMSCTCWGDF